MAARGRRKPVTGRKGKKAPLVVKAPDRGMAPHQSGQNRVRFSVAIPHRALSPNFRGHWAAVYRARAAQRKEAGFLCASTTAGWTTLPWEAARTRALFYWPNALRRDTDNAAAQLKGVWDGVQDAGLVANDAALRHEPVAFAVDRHEPRVEIIIERITEGELS